MIKYQMKGNNQPVCPHYSRLTSYMLNGVLKKQMFIITPKDTWSVISQPSRNFSSHFSDKSELAVTKSTDLNTVYYISERTEIHFIFHEVPAPGARVWENSRDVCVALIWPLIVAAWVPAASEPWVPEPWVAWVSINIGVRTVLRKRQLESMA